MNFFLWLEYVAVTSVMVVFSSVLNDRSVTRGLCFLIFFYISCLLNLVCSVNVELRVFSWFDDVIAEITHFPQQFKFFHPFACGLFYCS